MNYAGNGIVETRQFTFADFPIEVIQDPAPVPKPAKKAKPKRCEDQNDAGGCMIRESCGKKTAEDRATVGCTVPVMEKPAKKGKKRYSITIAPVTEDAPTLIEMGRKYLTDCKGPGAQGSGGSQDTKENTIRSILQTLNIWQKHGVILGQDVQFEDTTGEFTRSDFFDSGKLKGVPA